jgi:hypothetical protein
MIAILPRPPPFDAVRCAFFLHSLRNTILCDFFFLLSL